MTSIATQEKHIEAYDIDDVLLRNAEAIIQYSNLRWRTELVRAQYDDDWASMWGITSEEAERRRLDFLASGAMREYEALPGAAEALAARAQTHTLIAVTSRREAVRDDTEYSLDLHFNGLFSDLILCTYFDTEGVKITRSKADICREKKAKRLVDDHLGHCAAVAAVGVEGLLFHEGPVDPHLKLPELVVPVENGWRGLTIHYGSEGL